MNKFFLLVVFNTVLIISFVAQAHTRTDQSEAVISKICSVKADVLVLDTFGDNLEDQFNIDIDGDGTYDMLHGDFVARIVEVNGQKTIREAASVRAPLGMTIYPENLTKILNTYADKIEKGEIKLAWINFSQGYTVEIADINRLLGKRDVVTGANINNFVNEILQTLFNKKPNLKLQELYDALERMNKLGVPVVAAAANDGYGAVNIYSLFPQVISVGALNLAGKKAWYSADNSLVTVWRDGSILSYANQAGLDINSDGKADFSSVTRMVSDELLNSFNGKQVSKVLSQIPAQIDQNNDDNRTDFYQLTAKLPAGLYDTRLILRKCLATPFQQARYIASLGEYFYIDGLDSRPLFFMKANSASELQVGQGAGTSFLQYRNEIYGTSFAAPNICNGKKTPREYAL